MIVEKLKNIDAALGVFGGNVTEEQWGVISCIRGELKDCAAMAFELESRMMDEFKGDFVQMVKADDQKLVPHMDLAVDHIIAEAKAHEQDRQVTGAVQRPPAPWACGLAE